MNGHPDAAPVAGSFDFVVVGGGSAGGSSRAGSPRIPGAGWHCSRRAARPHLRS